MNFAFARRTELMLNVKLFRADIDLVNFTMLLPIVEIGAEAGPVTLLLKGTSKERAVDSLVKSGEEHGDEELGEPDGEAIVEEEEEEEEDIVGEVELASLSLESIFGDIAGDDVEDDVGGGTKVSNSDMVARLFLMRPMLVAWAVGLSMAALPGFSLSHFFSRATTWREPIASRLAILCNKYIRFTFDTNFSRH
jgi:hypothetical protein